MSEKEVFKIDIPIRSEIAETLAELFCSLSQPGDNLSTVEPPASDNYRRMANNFLILNRLVAIDPTPVDAVREADAAAVASHRPKNGDTAEWLAARVKDVPTRIDLADAVLAQIVGAK